MDMTVLHLAVPALTRDLAPSALELLWIVDIYGFFVAGFLITMGKLGDAIGRRKLLLIGAGAFGIASVFAAFSTSPGLLIAARALLGVSAATLAPSTLSLIRNMFHDPHERTFAIGVWIASFSSGAMLGPVLGGLMLEHFWWGSVFLLNVPVMLLLLAVGPWLLPEFRDPKPQQLDLMSALLSLAAVVAVIWAIKSLAGHGPSWIEFAVGGLGLGAGFMFVRRQQSLPSPLVDMTLFGKRAFSAALAVNLLSLFAAYGFFLYIAQYLQLVQGMSPLEAGLWTMISGGTFVIGTMLAPVLVRFIAPSHVISGGLTVGAFGFALLAFIGEANGMTILVIGMVVFCLGLAPVGTLTTDLVLSMAPPERAGMASGISETSFELGGALGIAVLGAIATAVYRAGVADIPLATPADADTLGAAVEHARVLGGADGAHLLETARAAFMLAFKVLAIFCATVSAATAVLAYALLRDADDAFRRAARGDAPSEAL